MLATLFPRVHTRYEVSRYAPDLEAFAAWLQATGYSHHSAQGHLWRALRTLERLQLLPGASFSESQLQQAFANDDVRYRATQRAFVRFLKHTGRWIAPPVTDQFAALRVDYRRYLAEMRGLTSSTAAQHDATVTELLAHAIGRGQPLSALTSEAIEQYVQQRSRELTRQSLQHVVARLRAFLRYGCAQKLWPSALCAIDTPRSYRGELPPRAIAWPLVVKLLASVKRTDRRGWRDYTVLHLMAYYGLRPSEIADLNTQSIDWAAKTLQVVQRKTRCELTLPLADKTLSILRRYLRAGRPVCTNPQLFLRARSPFGPITHYGVGDIFYTRAARSGLPLADASAYGLRHAFAMRLLSRGVGVKLIGDLLGHHGLESTCVYLRLDTKRLRAVALPLPREAASAGRQP